MRSSKGEWGEAVDVNQPTLNSLHHLLITESTIVISLRTILVLACTFLTLSEARSQMIVAHRGASHDAPENTLAAFRLAWQQGSDGIEGDFYVTADNQIVCIHDPDTEKTAGRKLEVAKATLAELRQLEYGAWKGEKYAGEPIPTLKEVFQTVPQGKTFVIELKSEQSIIPLLAEQVQQCKTDEIQLLVIAFDEATAAACKQQLPDIRVHWLTSFKNGRGKPVPSAKQIAATVRRLGVDGVGMKGDRRYIDKEFIQTLRDGGCEEFHVWTINDVQDARYFQQLGAVGITTDMPAVIGPALRNDANQ